MRYARFYVAIGWQPMLVKLSLAGMLVGFGILARSNNVIWMCDLGFDILMTSLAVAIAMLSLAIVQAHREVSPLPQANAVKVKRPAA